MAQDIRQHALAKRSMALVTLNQLLVLSAKGQLGSVVFYPHPFKAGLWPETKG